MDRGRRQVSLPHYRGELGAAYHQAKYGGSAFQDQVLIRARARKFQPYVSSRDEVFEFGVGKGWNLGGLTCKTKVGYDVADTCQEAAEGCGICFTSDASEVMSWAGRFDVVICHHVLEHVPEPFETLLLLRRLLKPTGRLVLCVPFEASRRFRRYRQGDMDMHLFSWSAQSLGNLLVSASYEIEELSVHRMGYERFLAPLARAGLRAYGAGLWLARLIRPRYETFAVARPERPPQQSAGGAGRLE